MVLEKQEWFETWFDTNFYHAVYGDHDEAEAKKLGAALLAYLACPKDSLMLDLACGKGRFSRFLAAEGYEVIGADLSAKSIASNQQFATERLQFFEHDMRKPFRINYFDYVFNIFTSFGYFQNNRDHLRTLQAVHQNLKPRGIFVFDYLNSQSVTKEALAPSEKNTESAKFLTSKTIENAFVVKKIKVIEKATSVTSVFEERVRLFSKKEFDEMFAAAGLKIVERFGDYSLQQYDEETSNRQIIIAKKI